MKWENNKRKATLVIGAAALVAFGTVFLLTGIIMTEVYGLTPLDPGYAHYSDPTGTIQNTPYQDFIANGCMTTEHLTTDKTIVLDTKGLEELGLFYYDPNTCFDLAKKLTNGYNIDDIETYGENGEQMKITLTKK